MSTLAIRLPRKPRRRSLLPALAVLGAVVLGLATGRIADSHYAKLIIEAAAAVGAFAAAVALMARRPRLGVIAILATLVFIPVYRVPTVQGLIFHPMIALCLLVASALFLLTYAGERSRLSAIDMSVMLLTATMLLGILFGPRSWKEVAAQLWVWLPPYIAGRVIAARRPLGRTLAIATVGFAVASSAFAVVEALGLGSPFFAASQLNNPLASDWNQPHLRSGESFRVQTAFGHPIAYAMFLAVAIVFALVLYASTAERRRKRQYLAAILILLGAEALTVSRTGWVVLAVTILILAIGRAKHDASRIARRALAAGALVLVAIALLLPSVAAVPLSILGLQSDKNDPALQNSASYRTGLYGSAARNDVFSWFGNKTSKLAQTVELHNSSIDSEYLNLLDQWGAIVVIPFLLVVGCMAIRAVTGVARSDDDWSNTFAATATGLGVGLGSVALITQQEYLVWLAFGLAAVPRGAIPLEGTTDSSGIWRFRPVDGAKSRTNSKTNAALIGAAIRRYWWIPMVSAVAVAGTALVIPRIVGEKYQSTSALLFQAPQFDKMLLSQVYGIAPHPRRDAVTNLALLDLNVVAARTAAAVGHGVTPARVSSEVQVAEVARSDIFTIQASDPDPRIAAALANTYAFEYKRLAIERQRSAIDQAAQVARKQVAAMRPAQRRSALGQKLIESLSNLTLLASLQNGNVEFVAQAHVPSSTSSPINKRGILYTLLLGFGLGLLIVAYVARRDSRLRDTGALEDAFGAPVVGTIPKLGASTLDQPPGSGAEAFGLLRGSLRYVNGRHRRGSLLVTSQTRHDGRTTVALNLARAEARAGNSRVLLVEADLRQPSLRPLLGLAPGPGLTEVLSRIVDLEEAICEVPMFHSSGNGSRTVTISVLPAGGTAPNPSALLESRAMSDLLESLEARYDVVIIDSPALSAVADAIPLLTRVGGVLVVARLGSIKRDQARSLREQLSGLKAPVVGIVANDPGEERSSRLPRRSRTAALSDALT